MGSSARLREIDVRAAMRLVGECRDFARDPLAWRLHASEGMNRLVGTCAANGGEIIWPRRQGLINLLIPVDVGLLAQGDRTNYHEYMKTHGPNHPMVLKALARMKGPVSTEIRTQWIQEDEWVRADFHAVYSECGLNYSMLSMAEPEGSPTTNVMVLHRPVGERDFTARERNLFHLFHEELARLIGAVLAIAGKHDDSLSPRLRQTLERLLLGDSEKQVARYLGLSRATVHQYVTALYRRFGVNTRAELLARFVR